MTSVNDKPQCKHKNVCTQCKNISNLLLSENVADLTLMDKKKTVASAAVSDGGMQDKNIT
jgi:hypothetical protein